MDLSAAKGEKRMIKVLLEKHQSFEVIRNKKFLE